LDFDELNGEITCCRRCPRLVEYREAVAREKRKAFREWTYWGRPVTGFGDPKARLLIVGLAPAAHGANRTGRIFTGDRSGSFLMQGLHAAGFANKPDSVHRDDGLKLKDAFITAIIRCAPPANKPLPQEILHCRPYLLAELDLLTNVKAVLALGRIGMDGYLDALAARDERVKRLPFSHGAEFQLPVPYPRLFVSYHPSQQNTQTGKLTAAQFGDVLRRIRKFLG